jgi:two-component system, cell cycle sensor histidine kinase and response regulator CckA
MDDRTSELAAAREALDAQMGALAEHAPFAISIRDLNGRYLAVNPMWEKYFGLSKKIMTGSTPWEVVIDPDDPLFNMVQEGKVDFENFIATGNSEQTEIAITLTTGRKVNFIRTRFPILDETGALASVGTIFQDVSELRRLSEERETLEAQMKAFFELAPFAIALRDIEGRYIAVNQQWETFVGRKADSVIGRTPSELVTDAGNPIFPRLQSEQQDFDFVVSTGQVTSSEHAIFDTRGGERLVLRTRFPIRGNDGGVLGVGTIMQDLTERRRIEAQLVQNAKLATIGELSAGILHELAQPLNIARMAAQAVLRKIHRDGAIENPLPHFEMIENQMARMAGVIDHMRVFSRSDQPEEQLFDARHAIRSATQMVQHSFAAENISIEISLPARRTYIKGRSIALEQVILNLLSNARDAINQISKTHDRSGGQINIELKVQFAAKTALITVSDDGGGIPEQAFPKLWDPFFTTKPVGRGTGLGLPVCQSLVRGMLGELSAANTENGAVFTIRLPLQSLGPLLGGPSAAAEREWASQPGLDRVVLLVDDEAEALQLMADFFEELGFDIRTASNGDEGLRCFRDSAIDLVVTDIRLPVCDGIEMAQQIRAMNFDVPIIFVTGHMGVTEGLSTFANQKCIRLIHKPIDLNVLERAATDLMRMQATIQASN